VVVSVVWQWPLLLLQTGVGSFCVHDAIPPVLVQVKPSGHVLQVAASAAVVPNANNDIEVTNNNEGTRNMGLLLA
jgi:hypothetical protein